MVTLYKDSPEYQYKEAKYIIYFDLFEDVDNQIDRVRVVLSHGWRYDDMPSNFETTSFPKSEFRYIYSVDGSPAMKISNVRITISGHGIGAKNLRYIQKSEQH